MSISPPAKVKKGSFEPFDIMASGIDTLELSIYVNWTDNEFFDRLDEYKGFAQETREDHPCIFNYGENGEQLIFMMKSFGSKGYKWLLERKDFELKIFNSLKPTTKPNILVKIRSETLWHRSPQSVIDYIVDLLMALGGRSILVLPSRIDLCVDFLMPTEQWDPNIRNFRVSRAVDNDPHFKKDVFTGYSIGKTNMRAVLYDKPLEIRQRSKKYWMFDVWGIKQVPSGFKIIRCEFMFRRPMLTELNIKTIEDLFGHLDNLWGYATRKWLKFRDRPGKHHTQRTTLDWWIAVQNGFLGVQDPTPAVRAKALNYEKDKLLKQIYGYATKLAALKMEEEGVNLIKLPTLFSILEAVFQNTEYSNSKFIEDVFKKRIQMHKGEQKWQAAEELRSERHLPSSKTKPSDKKDLSQWNS